MTEKIILNLRELDWVDSEDLGKIIADKLDKIFPEMIDGDYLIIETIKDI